MRFFKKEGKEVSEETTETEVTEETTEPEVVEPAAELTDTQVLAQIILRFAPGDKDIRDELNKIAKGK